MYIEDIVNKFWRILWWTSWTYLGLLVVGGVIYRYFGGEVGADLRDSFTLHLGIAWGGVLTSFVVPFATMDWTERKRIERLSLEERIDTLDKSMNEVISSLTNDHHGDGRE